MIYKKNDWKMIVWLEKIDGKIRDVDYELYQKLNQYFIVYIARLENWWNGIQRKYSNSSGVSCTRILFRIAQKNNTESSFDVALCHRCDFN